MSLYTKILIASLERKNIRSISLRLRRESDRLVNDACQQAIQEIREVVSETDPNEEDTDHFLLIQRVLVALSKIGVDLNWNEFK